MVQALPIIAVVATVVGTGLAVASSIQQNRLARAQAAAQRNNAIFQAQVAKNNSILAERLAQDAINRGELDARRHKLRVGQLQAEQEVAFAGQGLEVGLGTPLDVFADTARTGELDVFTIQANAEREALGLRTQSQQFLSQRELFLAESRAPAPPGPALAAGATALGGLGSAATQFVEFREAGVL